MASKGVLKEDRKATFDSEEIPVEDATHEEELDVAATGELGKQKSKTSLHSGHSSGASSSDSNNNGKEMPDRLQYKVLHMTYLLVGIAANAVLLALNNSLKSPEGWFLGTFTDFVAANETILLFLLCILVYVSTYTGLERASHAFFGYLYSTENGYSLTAFGFFRGGIWHRLTFTDRLSLRSSCRKLLSRVSYFWVLHFFSILLAAYAVHGIRQEKQRLDQGQLSCMIYGQNGNIYDRGWPNLDTAMGSAEYVFGTSLGHMRSEEPVNVTTFVMPPQLVDTCNDGTTIIGDGYTIDILTSCQCAHSMDPSHLDAAGIDADSAAQFNMMYTDKNKAFVTMLNKFAMSSDNSELIATTILTRTYLCGGTNVTHPAIPVCTTRFFNHRTARVEGTYMTDGTPASIALKKVKILASLDGKPYPVANIRDWFYPAMKNLFYGLSFSDQKLYETIPGSVSPITWWTTANMQAMGFAYLEVGLETMWSIISRASIQRSYATKGSTCVQNVASTTSLVFYNEATRSDILTAFIIIQFIIQFFAIAAYVPWLRSPNAIAPAVRLLDDPVYLVQMISNSPFASSLVPVNATSDTREFWTLFDKRVRIGESKKTQEDPEYGLLILDKPRFVTSLTWGKLYS